MLQSTIDFFQGSGGLPPELIIAFISVLPIFELRGGLIAASIMGVPMGTAFLVCLVANFLPIPFLLLFLRAIMGFMKRFRWIRPFIEWLERKGEKQSAQVARNKLLGLFAFVAIPLPGTGGWTGALVATALKIPFRKALPAIWAGVFGAGLIMLVITYFIPGLFGFVIGG